MKILFKDHPEFLDWYLVQRGVRKTRFTGLLIREDLAFWISEEDEYVNDRWMWILRANKVFVYLKENFPEALL